VSYIITVKLAGQEYRVEPMKIREARAWRERFALPFDAIAGALNRASSVQLKDGPALAGLLQDLAGTLIHSVDTLLDMLYAYAPAIAADRERIEAEADDQEAMAALLEVFKLAYPFGRIFEVFQVGQKDPKTPKK
jgi:hypothetical protein